MLITHSKLAKCCSKVTTTKNPMQLIMHRVKLFETFGETFCCFLTFILHW